MPTANQICWLPVVPLPAQTLFEQLSSNLISLKCHMFAVVQWPIENQMKDILKDELLRDLFSFPKPDTQSGHFNNM